jgi:negative regulator of sigma-B (phosphoserine phosphatase)
MRGEQASGDAHVVLARRTGSLIAVVDGIGHGIGAAEAAKAASLAIARHQASGAIALVRRCHEALIGTRGVVMSMAIVDQVDDTLTWLGVGNVSGVLCRSDPAATPRREEMFARGGVVGLQLPLLQASVAALAPGDVVVMATDGVRHGFADAFSTRESPSVVAKRILREHGRDTDDALVLVARYLGRRDLRTPPQGQEAT